jgi:branched-subunit amino acid transport protein
VAAFTAYKTRNVLITILIGMTVIIVLNRFMPF